MPLQLVCLCDVLRRGQTFLGQRLFIFGAGGEQEQDVKQSALILRCSQKVKENLYLRTMHMQESLAGVKFNNVRH